MEMVTGSHEKASLFARGWSWFKALFTEKLLALVIGIAKQSKKIAVDDPRRVTHSLKVGLALSLVSSFYYFQPLYNSFGASAMWAVITVVVVFEYSVGATIGKGFNRGLATLLGGALGIGAHQLASITGKVGEPILLGLFVFLQAAASTFIRFFPHVKARYDYGLLIFILTFCLVTLSGYRSDDILELVYQRLSTAAIGASICVTVSILLCPIWAGEDLHNLIAQNIEKLGDFLEGFGDTYFGTLSDSTESKQNKAFLVAYKSVLDSKNSEEALANVARWEPGHGGFMYGHPWKQYLKIGALTRHCACRIEAINSYYLSSEASPEIRGIIQETSTKMSMESGKALKEMALAMKTMTKPSTSAKQHIGNSQTAAKALKTMLISDHLGGIVVNLVQLIPVATVSSMLIDVVVCIENIADAVDELASLAQFKATDHQEIAPDKLPQKNDEHHHHVVVQLN